MKVEHKPCECQYGWASDVLDDGRKVCLECWILWDYSEEIGITPTEFEGVLHVDRPSFLADKFNAIALSGHYRIQPERAKEIWQMLDKIKTSRRTFGMKHF